MNKVRRSIPVKVERDVRDAFNDRCAICGFPHPQIHHIDENPSNNAPLNLLPLCPNCHLIDQHNPTRRIDTDLLRFFREYKDPYILWPQFLPIFERMGFLRDLAGITETASTLLSEDLSKHANNLTAFIKMFEMGEFYSETIEWLLKDSSFLPVSSSMDAQTLSQIAFTREHSYRTKLISNRIAVEKNIVEMLRYQKWQRPSDFGRYHR